MNEGMTDLSLDYDLSPKVGTEGSIDTKEDDLINFHRIMDLSLEKFLSLKNDQIDLKLVNNSLHSKARLLYIDGTIYFSMEYSLKDLQKLTNMLKVRFQVVDVKDSSSLGESSKEHEQTKIVGKLNKLMKSNCQERGKARCFCYEYLIEKETHTETEKSEEGNLYQAEESKCEYEENKRRADLVMKNEVKSSDKLISPVMRDRKTLNSRSFDDGIILLETSQNDDDKSYQTERKFAMIDDLKNFRGSDFFQEQNLDDSPVIISSQKKESKIYEIRSSEDNILRKATSQENNLKEENVTQKIKSFFQKTLNLKVSGASSGERGSTKDSTAFVTEPKISQESTLSAVHPYSNSLTDLTVYKNPSEGEEEKDQFEYSSERGESGIFESSRGSSKKKTSDYYSDFSTREVTKLMKKEIPKFSGTIYMRFSSQQEWQRYFLRIDDVLLLFYENSLDRTPKMTVPSCRCFVKYMETMEKDYIEIFHENDSEKMIIVIDTETKDQNNSANPFRNLRMWYIQLKIASQKTGDLKLAYTYYPIGKLQLTVLEASFLKGFIINSTCYIKISHVPYNFTTSDIQSSETIKWDQGFLIPLCDPFLPVTLELIAVTQEGWLKGTRREEVICTGELLVADVLSENPNSEVNINLDLKYTETKKKQIIKTLGLGSQELIKPRISLKVRNLSGLKSLFAPPSGDYVDGIYMTSNTYVKQHFKLALKRIRRMIRHIRMLNEDISNIFNFKYPLFSCCCLFFFSYLIITLQLEELFQNFLLLILTVSIYNYPVINSRLKPVLVNAFFKDTDLNKFYAHSRIKTIEDINKQKDLNTEKWKYKILDEDNIVTQLLIIKRFLAWLTIFLTRFAGFCERLKNLLFWAEPTRTLMFIGFGLCLYCVIVIVPMRYVILMGVWMNFVTGLNYYKRLRIRNEEVAKFTLNFIIKRHFRSFYTQICQKNSDVLWPNILSFHVFQSKIVEQFNFRLGLALPEDALVTFKSKQELIKALTNCPKKLTFKTSSGEKADLGKHRWKVPKFSAGSLLNFVMNVPSDYYRVVHPKMKMD